MKIFKHLLSIIYVAFIGTSFVNAATATVTHPTCNGSSDGSIVVSGVSGGAGPDFTYYLYNSNPFPVPPLPVDQYGPTSDVSHTFSGLSASKYWIYITDNTGDVIIILTPTLTNPLLLTLPAPVITDVTCSGTSDGEISVLANGGTAPYTYILKKGAAIIQNSGPQPGPFTFSGLAGGNDYTVTLDDNNNCGPVISGFLTVGAPSVLSVSVIPNSGSVCAGSNFPLSATPSGGNGGITYLWSATSGSFDNNTSQTPVYSNPLAGGPYIATVNITDSKGCTANGTSSITVNAIPVKPTITAGGPTTFCTGGSVTLTSSAGTSYLWSTGATTSSINVISSARYTVQVTNASGCQSVASNPTVVTVNTFPAKPTITAGGPTTFCAGGSVTLTSSAGAAYLWSTGATTSSIVVNATGSYTVQVTNAGGCQSVPSDPTAVTVNALPAKPTITAGGPTTFCTGGSVTLTSSAGTSYLWSTGATTSSINVNTTGNYTVRVTNAAGCQSVASNVTAVTVNALPAKPTITAGGPTTFCAGGSVTLTSSAGTSYLWSTGATTSSIIVSTTGSYTVQVTNAAGCQSVASNATAVTVNAVPAKPTIAAGGPTTFCTGGSVTLTSSAGTSYLWSTGATTSSINVSISGSYTVQVTNAIGCQSVPSDPTVVTVNTIPAKPTITAGGPTTFCTGGSVTLTSSAGTSYLWSTGATTSSINVSISGSYTVQVTNAGGCQSVPSDPTTVTVNAVPAKPTISAGGPTTFCTGGSVTLTSSAGTSYLWSTGATTSSINVNSTGSYTVQVANAAGCQSVPSNAMAVTVNTLPAKPTITAGGPTTFCAGGSVSLTSSAATSYLWSTGASTSSINVSTTGSYTVQVTNAAGCQSVASDATAVTVNALPNITYTVSDPTVCFYENALIDLSSSESGITYILRDNTNTMVDGPLNGTGASLTFTLNALTLAVGPANYNVLATTASGCSIVLPDLAVVTKKPEITFTFTQTDPTCNGLSNGKINITPSNGTPPYSVSLDNGTSFPYTTGTDINVAAGNYQIIVKDAGNCLSIVQNAVIGQPQPLVSSVVKTDISCNGFNNGTVTVTASGGTLPYNYSKNGITYQLSNVFNALIKNTYTISTKDSKGCISTNVVTIDEPLALSIPSEIKIDNNVCYGDTLGEIRILLVSGGVAPYQYSIDGGLNFFANGIFQNLAAGDYQTTIKDANGCLKNGNVNKISQPAKMVINNYAQVDVADCFGNTNGQIAIEAAGGTGALNYNLDGLTDNSSGIFAGVGGGSHLLTMTDTKACSIDTTVVLSEPSEMIFSGITISDVTGCKGDLNGEVDALATGGAGTYEYSFDGGAFQGSGNFPGLAAGSYTLSVRDLNMCIRDTIVTISEPEAVSILSEDSTDISCTSANDGTISIRATGGTGPYTYVLNPGAIETNNTGDFISLSQGNYTVAVTDVLGCGPVDSNPLTINEPLPLVRDSVKSKEISCNGSDNAEIHIYISGGTSPYSYSNDDETTYGALSDFMSMVSGTYYLSVKDANACTLYLDTLIFIEPTALSVVNESKLDISTCFDDPTGEVDFQVTGGTGSIEYSLDLLTWQGTGNFTGLNSGTYTVTARDQNLCTLASSALIIDEPSQITADITTTPDINEFNKGSISIANAAGGTGALVFSITGDLGAFSAQTDYLGLDAGTYPVVVRDDNNCTFKQDAIIASVPILDVTVTLVNPTCNGDADGSIKMVCLNGDPLIQFSIDDSTTWAATGDFTNLGPGSYKIFVRDGMDRYFQDTVLITEPLPINIFGSITPSTCSSFSNDGIIDVTVNGGNSPYTYLWSGGETIQDLNNINAGDYTLSVTDLKSCTSEKTFVVPAVNSVVANAGMDTTICSGEDILLNGQGGAVLSWSPTDGLSNPNIFNPVVSITEDKSYVLTVVGFNDCFDTDTINIIVRPEVEINAGNDTTIFRNTQTYLNATGGPFESYSWMPATGLTTPGESLTLAKPFVTTNYVVSGVTEFGCTVTDTVKVTVAVLKVYNVFSPNNGDDKNNYFEIENINLYPNALVEVFTRWGEKLFSSKGYSDEQRWDGTFKGKDVPVGTYYYVIVPFAGAEAITGPLTIVR